MKCVSCSGTGIIYKGLGKNIKQITCKTCKGVGYVEGP